MTPRAGDRLPGVAVTVTGVGLGLTLLVALALLLAAVGTRWDWWGFRAGFAILRAALVGGLLAILVVLVGLVLGLLARSARALALSLASLLLLAAAGAPPIGHLRAVGRVPPIHDITTDLDDPPRFVAVLPRRRSAPNPAEHAGPELAARQRAGYPELGPARFAVPPDRVFARAVEVARDLDWTIVAAVPAEGRLEATARTRWFGFRDDVVVRVKPDGAGTRVDVRSASRVGRSDLGTNARRIRRFLAALGAKIETR